MRPWLKFGLVGVLVLALAAGGFLAVRTVAAQTSATPAPVQDDTGGLYLRGTLTAASASELTVDAGGTAWKVQLDADTAIHVAGNTTATYSDLVLKQTVTVKGTYTAANTLKASIVSQGRLQGLRDLVGKMARRGLGNMLGLAKGNVIIGTVVSTTETSITVKKADNSEVTVAVNSETTYMVPGDPDASLADISAGMTVTIQPADASAQAPAILVVGHPAGFNGMMGRGFGRGFGPGQGGCLPGTQARPGTEI